MIRGVHGFGVRKASRRRGRVEEWPVRIAGETMPKAPLVASKEGTGWMGEREVQRWASELPGSGSYVKNHQALQEICLHYSIRSQRSGVSVPTMTELPPPHLMVTQHALEATLGTNELWDSVKWPHGCELREWLGKCLWEVTNDCQLVMTLVSLSCSCAAMSSGKHLYATEKDDLSGLTYPTATQYMDAALKYCLEQLNAISLFSSYYSTSLDAAPDAQVVKTAKRMARLLFRVYAHTYRHHMDDFVAFGAVAHLNCCFKRLVYLACEFALVQIPELAPLMNIVKGFVGESRLAQFVGEPAHENTPVPSHDLKAALALRRAPTAEVLKTQLGAPQT